MISTNPASRRKSSTFQTSTISDGHFPLKAEDCRAVHPALLGEEKRTTPRQKLMIRKSSHSFQSPTENQNQGLKLFKKTIDKSRGGSVLVCTPSLANLLCFVSSLLKQKIRKIYQQFIKKIVNPERRFVLPENTKHDGISCFQSPTWWARGGFKHRAAFAALSSRQSTRGQPTPQRRREEGLLDGGNGWGRRVAERLWLLEIMTKIISWKILEWGTCSEICYSILLKAVHRP